MLPLKDDEAVVSWLYKGLPAGEAAAVSGQKFGLSSMLAQRHGEMQLANSKGFPTLTFIEDINQISNRTATPCCDCMTAYQVRVHACHTT